MRLSIRTDLFGVTASVPNEPDHPSPATVSGASNLFEPESTPTSKVVGDGPGRGIGCANVILFGEVSHAIFHAIGGPAMTTVRTVERVPDNSSAQIKELRGKLGPTQVRLAERLGVSFATVNQREIGRSKPSPFLWRQLTEIANEPGKRN